MVTVAVSNDSPGLGPKKTFLVMVTVIGCIAILWPKVFYPMMFSTPPKPIKDYRNGPGCCEVVLDQQKFANVSNVLLESTFRKKMNLITGEYSIRQERPPHLRPDGIHPAMRERGRAIPNAPTVPIVTEKSRMPKMAAPRVVEGRPGPIPGMRPPMGAGSVHQATQKGNSMGLIMPLYTIGIVAFFIYTIMKLIFKKPEPSVPYGEPTKPNPDFKKQVFGQDKHGGTITNLGWKEHDTIVTAIQGLIDAADEQLCKQENSMGLSKNTTEQNGDIPLIQNGHTITADISKDSDENIETLHAADMTGVHLKSEIKRRDRSNDRSVKKPLKEAEPQPQSIFLEGSLSHESQILVSDSETTAEEIFDEELNGTVDEPAVVLSSKMTLSLINLDPIEKLKSNDSQSEKEVSEEEYSEEEIEEIVEEEADDEVTDEEELEHADNKTSLVQENGLQNK